MRQDIHMAAILERDGRLFLVRARPDAPWELPGGPLPLENDDIDAEMDAILQRLGVMAPAIEEDFLQTHYFPVEGGQVVYNVYAATEWAGDPSVSPGHGAGWFGLEDIQAIHMDERARNAILQAFGMKAAEDDTARIMAALSGQAAAAPAGAPSLDLLPVPETGNRGERSRRAAGLDVLGALRASDALEAAARLERARPELAGDIIDFALGEVWASPALDPRTRSLEAISMLAATGRTGAPLRTHIEGALNYGVSPEQVVETLRMVAVYAGFPAALEAWPVMEATFAQRGIPRPGRPS
ncbi:MAG: carboxymuconolactone decarboxylase family protein [Dehalococcoidia bacterium]|nr:carboxymuconolactone decarboxylase family protein [Dehalococcoidia bacterium]